ncbi:MAG: malonic semialdehyde reductase [Alphaproteobacteria bacterium]|nr:malonic semialdehyde reductase [Alphaproteobacteria bacterium]
MDDPTRQAQDAVRRVRARIAGLDADALDLLFIEARSHYAWMDRPVPDTLIHTLYEVMKWGPTSACSCPAKIVFLKTAAAKERLRPALVASNVAKTMTAPVVAVIGHDLDFHTYAGRLCPGPMPGLWAANEQLAQVTAFRNGTLQGAYLLIAARALGLDAAPLSGFDNAKLDAIFFAGTRIASNFICALGYGDVAMVRQKWGRLSFDEACRIL